ncbi:FUSC family protein [Gluconacetobacter takamatsuzukensis]|uniref:FUSC family protein n=1 Tax=Gluconacetobacter takamatsuzukensis TaxID=1286190 RepID=A0A7W4PQM4_9PROT|nr:FUSC family protein [Gluconacetobacter takamatsuzukensis]MBB2206543.1 FUSC family protein [Gluconacetobacter takamatsuzukensis]
MKNSPFPPLPRTPRFPRALAHSLMPSVVTHWLGARAIAIAPEQIAIREGLRAGVAVSTIMLVAWHIAMPLMAWSAFAAFWTCLADPGGLLRPRIRALTSFGVAGAAITGTISALAGYSTAAAFAGLGLCAFLCGLARARGPVATQVSVLAAIVAVVAVCYPQTLAGAVTLAGLFSLGVLWAMLICLLAWPVDPSTPQKQACAALFREQAAMAFRLLGLPHLQTASLPTQQKELSAWRRDIRRRIEQARSAVEKLSGNTPVSPAYATLLPAVEAADRIFVTLIAFEHAAFSAPLPPETARVIRITSAALRRIARDIPAGRHAPDSLGPHIRALGRLGAHPNALSARAAAWNAAALTDLQAAWQARDQPRRDATPSAPATPWQHPGPIFVRHAARLSVAVMAAFGITLAFHLPYAYWAMMAVVVVTQPGRSTTLSRTIERVAGSVAGGILAAIAGTLCPKWLVLLLIFPLSATTIALRSVNYTLCVTFMTQLFVLVTDLVGSDTGWLLGFARAENNIIGSLVGMAACLLLWPEKSTASLPTLVSRAFLANLRYAARVATGDNDREATERARRQAGTTSNKAEILCQQTSLEGLRRSENLKICTEILFHLRRQAGIASTSWLEQATDHPPIRAEQAYPEALRHFSTLLADPASETTSQAHLREMLLFLRQQH